MIKVKTYDYRRLHDLRFYIIALFTILYFICSKHLISGVKIIYTHPYITSDGYDWLVEAEYILNYLGGNVGPNKLVILRQPGYVVTLMIDHIFGGTGKSLTIINTLLFGGLLTSLFGCMKELKFSKILQSVGILIFCFSPLIGNFFAIFAELQSMTFMYFSLWMILLYLKSGSLNKLLLILATVSSILGGITKTYCLLPILFFATYNFFESIKKRKLGHLTLAAIISSLSFILIEFFWRYVPHRGTPSTFSLLFPTTKIPPMVLDAFLLGILPLLPVIIISLFYRPWKQISTWVLHFTGIALTLLCLYSWWDSRFFLVFYPVFIFFGLSFWSSIPNTKRLKSSLMGIGFALFVYMFVANTIKSVIILDFRFREFSKVEFNKSTEGITLPPHWAAQILQSKGIKDRFNLMEKCGALVMCRQAASTYQTPSKYETSVMKFYFEVFKDKILP